MYDLKNAQAYIRRYGAIRPSTKFVIVKLPDSSKAWEHIESSTKGPYIPITESELPQFLKSGCTIVGEA
jgi:hypothetical protein